MSGVEQVKSEGGMWTFIVPVSGLTLTNDVSQEITVGSVTFVSRKKLPRIRKRLGFPWRLKELKEQTRESAFFEESPAYAIATFGGIGREKEAEFLTAARDELDLLSLSQLGFGRRRRNACLSISNEIRPGSLQYFMTNSSKKTWSMQRQKSGRFMRLDLDAEWVRFQRLSFFYELLDVINGRTGVSQGWKRDIKNAAILAGKSQSSSDLAHAFLWNVIAIETLLAHQGDSYSTALPKRVESFIGWTTDWSVGNFGEKIEDIYKKRCTFVHAGRSDDLTIKDLLFTDTILVNVFYNILKHIDIFPNKDALIEFSKKVEAEHILGVRPKVRPKTISYINVSYSEADYERL